MPARGSGKRRVFFALWPDEHIRGRLAELAIRAQAQFGGRPVRADALHMTMAFIGDVDSSLVDSATAAANGLGAQPGFSMAIDRLHCWRHNRIAWCGPQGQPAELTRLATRLHGRLTAAGFRLEARAFAAHITLLRHADCSRVAPCFEPFDWDVQQFVLVESNLTAASAEYSIIGCWPLAESNRTQR